MSVANAPTPAQRRAADPTRSVWVTANAGTGKTRVLSDRVLRLLLAGAAPESILCLTFTKAAAAEMAVRIEGRLAGWAVERDEARLRDDLRNLLGEPPSARTLKDARRLFARVLDLARGLNIMTIHSFCQTLLRRFPLEAGVAPHFETIDDRTAAELMNEARQIVLAERCISEPSLQKAVEILAVTLAESTLTEAIREMLGQRQRLTACFARHHPAGLCDGLLARIEHLLEVEAGAEPPQLIARACADGQFDHLGLYRIANQLVQSDKKTDIDAGSTILTWLNAAEADRILYFDKYSRSFLTQDGKPRKQLCTKRFVDTCLAVLTMEQARLVHLHDSIEALTHARRTAALLRLGHAVISEYEELKRRGSLLDFDDLIEHARRLLSTPGRKEWVLFKLDERLDHVLVDEAQDTSPAQWEIVERLSEEFLAGLGAHPGPRTLFVVGDEKQSIYSFQGADLENFRSVRDKLRGLAAAAPLAFAEETLDISFRSTRAVLEGVDRVLARPELQGVVKPGETVRHRTNRANAPGLVELWPMAAHDDAIAETEPWPLPTQPRRTDEPQRRVADGLAAQVQAWLARGELIDGEDGPRPIRPGDVLVLVARRTTIQQLTIRALKAQGIPVAGADRLPLAEHIAVRDLIALGRAILLPEDDLNLACLLKSPLLGLDEDQLFDLAYDRGPASLLERLRNRAGAGGALGAAYDRLSGWMARADFMPPFELYTNVLGAGRGRERLLARLGPDAAEPIEAFLGQALAYEKGHPASLEGFLHWLELDPRQLKRDPEQARDAVRVMTVHGAKGLEAPIVILADAGPHGDPRAGRLIWHENELPLWRHARFRNCAAAIEADRRQQREERQRLLYVALTRARDRLYITGWHNRKPPKDADPCWHAMVAMALAEHESVERFPLTLGRLYEGEALRLHLGAPPAPAQLVTGHTAAELPLPAWVRVPAAEERASRRPLAPSRLAAEEPGPDSPAGTAARDRIRHGLLVHRLLQVLPELPEPSRDDAGRRLLERIAPDLPPEARAGLLAETLAVLRLPGLEPLFAPGSRAEQPICGMIGEESFAGQIDRLAVTDDAVLIVDYKTTRQPPASAEAAPVAYLRQLAAYGLLLRQIYPGRDIVASLLWTQGPRLDRLPQALLDRHHPDAPATGLPRA